MCVCPCAYSSRALGTRTGTAAAAAAAMSSFRDYIPPGDRSREQWEIMS